MTERQYDPAAEFVRARLVEREQLADAMAVPGERFWIFPDEIRADVASKRELLDLWEATRQEGDRPHPLAVRLADILAGAWASHPDYSPQWGTPKVAHKTERHQDFGDGSVDYRVDREYYWTCTCGHRSENNSFRTQIDDQRLAHEQANR